MVKVLRVREGDEVRIFTGEGKEFIARVEKADPAAACVLISGAYRPVTPVPARLILAFAPPPGQRADSLVEKGSELGADVFQPLLCERLQGFRARGAARRAERWQRKAADAARQSERAIVPEVREPMGFEDFVTAGGCGLRLIASTQATERLWTFLARAGRGQAPAAVSMAIGPAGGFTRRELDLARGAGFEAVSLGPHTLRVETAAISVLAAVVLWLDSFRPSRPAYATEAPASGTAGSPQV
jgi:16S rRNA (uracil1498-N3)-methyltransferase